MRPATGPHNGPLWCKECGWKGLRLETIKAALRNEGTAEESFVAQCPGCKSFNLLTPVYGGQVDGGSTVNSP